MPKNFSNLARSVPDISAIWQGKCDHMAHSHTLYLLLFFFPHTPLGACQVSSLSHSHTHTCQTSSYLRNCLIMVQCYLSLSKTEACLGFSFCFCFFSLLLSCYAVLHLTAKENKLHFIHQSAFSIPFLCPFSLKRQVLVFKGDF